MEIKLGNKRYTPTLPQYSKGGAGRMKEAYMDDPFIDEDPSAFIDSTEGMDGGMDDSYPDFNDAGMDTMDYDADMGYPDTVFDPQDMSNLPREGAVGGENFPDVPDDATMDQVPDMYFDKISQTKEGREYINAFVERALDKGYNKNQISKMLKKKIAEKIASMNRK